MSSKHRVKCTGSPDLQVSSSNKAVSCWFTMQVRIQLHQQTVLSISTQWLSLYSFITNYSNRADSCWLTRWGYLIHVIGGITHIIYLKHNRLIQLDYGVIWSINQLWHRLKRGCIKKCETWRSLWFQTFQIQITGMHFDFSVHCSATCMRFGH